VAGIKRGNAVLEIQKNSFRCGSIQVSDGVCQVRNRKNVRISGKPRHAADNAADNATDISADVA
jgi:hypothetical protein